MKSISLLVTLFGLLLSTVTSTAATRSDAGLLKIFWLATHASTLIALPDGTVILIDSGNADRPDTNGGTCADRICNVIIQELKTNVIHHYISTHWHNDHIGGIGASDFNGKIVNSPRRVTVRQMYGRTNSASITNTALDQFKRYTATENLSLNKATTIVKLGDTIYSNKWNGHTIKLTVVAVNGLTVNDSAREQSHNFCSPNGDNTELENRNSIALMLSVDNFRYLDTGDLWCEVAGRLFQGAGELAGGVDVYRTAHHGGSDSNPDGLFTIARPSVVILNNGVDDRQAGPKELRKRLKRLLDPKTMLYQLYLNQGESDADDSSSLVAVRNSDLRANKAQHCFITLTYPIGGKNYSVITHHVGPRTNYFSIRDKGHSR
ncbi:MAG: hypothetical protein HY043_07360 [Verrucomicrobia bacterium]|nr:hypothetical protein [Verrucomicrobiota bacterium]